MELLIYQFYIFYFIKVFHTEIRVFGVTVAYGDSGLSVSPSRIRSDMELVKIIQLGETSVVPEDFFAFLRGINLVYKTKNYDMFYSNCRHFSRLLIKELRPSSAVEGES